MTHAFRVYWWWVGLTAIAMVMACMGPGEEMRTFQVRLNSTGATRMVELPDDATKEQIEAETRKVGRELCKAAGHPDAFPVSSPIADHTEYCCEYCDEYFLKRDDEPPKVVGKGRLRLV